MLLFAVINNICATIQCDRLYYIVPTFYCPSSCKPITIKPNSKDINSQKFTIEGVNTRESEKKVKIKANQYEKIMKYLLFKSYKNILGAVIVDNNFLRAVKNTNVTMNFSTYIQLMDRYINLQLCFYMSNFVVNSCEEKKENTAKIINMFRIRLSDFFEAGKVKTFIDQKVNELHNKLNGDIQTVVRSILLLYSYYITEHIFEGVNAIVMNDYISLKEWHSILYQLYIDSIYCFSKYTANTINFNEPFKLLYNTPITYIESTNFFNSTEECFHKKFENEKEKDKGPGIFIRYDVSLYIIKLMIFNISKINNSSYTFFESKNLQISNLFKCLHVENDFIGKMQDFKRPDIFVLSMYYRLYEISEYDNIFFLQDIKNSKLHECYVASTLIELIYINYVGNFKSFMKDTFIGNKQCSYQYSSKNFLDKVSLQQEKVETAQNIQKYQILYQNFEGLPGVYLYFASLNGRKCMIKVINDEIQTMAYFSNKLYSQKKFENLFAFCAFFENKSKESNDKHLQSKASLQNFDKQVSEKLKDNKDGQKCTSTIKQQGKVDSQHVSDITKDYDTEKCTNEEVVKLKQNKRMKKKERKNLNKQIVNNEKVFNDIQCIPSNISDIITDKKNGDINHDINDKLNTNDDTIDSVCDDKKKDGKSNESKIKKNKRKIKEKPRESKSINDEIHDDKGDETSHVTKSTFKQTNMTANIPKQKKASNKREKNIINNVNRSELHNKRSDNNDFTTQKSVLKTNDRKTMRNAEELFDICSKIDLDDTKNKNIHHNSSNDTKKTGINDFVLHKVANESTQQVKDMQDKINCSADKSRNEASSPILQYNIKDNMHIDTESLLKDIKCTTDPDKTQGNIRKNHKKKHANNFNKEKSFVKIDTISLADKRTLSVKNNPTVIEKEKKVRMSNIHEKDMNLPCKTNNIHTNHALLVKRSSDIPAFKNHKPNFKTEDKNSFSTTKNPNHMNEGEKQNTNHTSINQGNKGSGKYENYNLSKREYDYPNPRESYRYINKHRENPLNTKSVKKVVNSEVSNGICSQNTSTRKYTKNLGNRDYKLLPPLDHDIFSQEKFPIIQGESSSTNTREFTDDFNSKKRHPSAFVRENINTNESVTTFERRQIQTLSKDSIQSVSQHKKYSNVIAGAKDEHKLSHLEKTSTEHTTYKKEIICLDDNKQYNDSEEINILKDSRHLTPENANPQDESVNGAVAYMLDDEKDSQIEKEKMNGTGQLNESSVDSPTIENICRRLESINEGYNSYQLF